MTILLIISILLICVNLYMVVKKQKRNSKRISDTEDAIMTYQTTIFDNKKSIKQLQSKIDANATLIKNINASVIHIKSAITQINTKGEKDAPTRRNRN